MTSVLLAMQVAEQTALEVLDQEDTSAWSHKWAALWTQRLGHLGVAGLPPSFWTEQASIASCRALDSVDVKGQAFVELNMLLNKQFITFACDNWRPQHVPQVVRPMPQGNAAVPVTIEAVPVDVEVTSGQSLPQQTQKKRSKKPTYVPPAAAGAVPLQVVGEESTQGAHNATATDVQEVTFDTKLRDTKMTLVAMYDSRTKALACLRKEPPQGYTFERSHQYKDRIPADQKGDLGDTEKVTNNNEWTSVHYCAKHLVGVTALASTGVVGQMAGLQVEDPQGVQQVSCGVWVKLKPCVGGQCAMYITAYHPQDSTDTHKISSIIHPLHVAMVTFGLRMGNAPTVIHHNLWYVLHAAWSVARNSWMCVARYTAMTRQSLSWCQLHKA